MKSGGGIYASGLVFLAATIVAKNGGGGDCSEVDATFNDQGFNVASDGSCGLSTANHSISQSPNIDASLGPLSGNGGPTRTVLPSGTSPAVGAIPVGTKLGGVTVCPRHDQRGVASYGKCTMGAVEGGFLIVTTSLPMARRGQNYGPVKLVVQEPGASTKPFRTTFGWKGISLPKGVALSAGGVLFGTPNTALVAGSTRVEVKVTETVTTIVSKRKITSTKTVQASIPLEVA